MTPESIEWADDDTAPITHEWELFKRTLQRERFKPHPSRPRPWIKRCEAWLVHATAWAQLKESSLAHGTKENRIAFLFDHLNVLDTKLGMLLNFNSILLVSINVMFSLISNFTRAPGEQSLARRLFMLHPQTMLIFIGASGFFAACWFVATMLGLLGQRRLVWGDLGRIHEKTGARQLKVAELGDGALLERAEQEHVQALIVAVVKRSNKFRIATAVTLAGVIGLAVAIVTGSVLLWTTG
jgi:hypothetical protein